MNNAAEMFVLTYNTQVPGGSEGEAAERAQNSETRAACASDWVDGVSFRTSHLGAHR